MAFLLNFFSEILGGIVAFFSSRRPAPAASPAEPVDLGLEVRRELWLVAAEKFRQNLPAYCRGKLVWKSGQTGGARYNCQLWQADQTDGAHLVALSVFLQDKTDGRFTLLGTKKGSAADYAAQAADINTWCHIAAGYWSTTFAGISLNVIGGESADCNRAFDAMAAGDLNLRGWEFSEVETAEALELARRYFPIFAIAPRLGRGKVGHVAIIQPDGLTAQAGAKTGFDIPIEVGFGPANLPAVRYFVLEKTGEDEAAENGTDEK